MNSKQVGVLGERIAERYLKNKGHQILDKNYSFKIPGNLQKGEIDIITKKDGTITFVEVKMLVSSARGGAGFLPEDKVDFSKQRKIIKTSQSWLMEKKIPLDSKWQIDIISIKLDQETQKAKIRHFKNAVF